MLLFIRHYGAIGLAVPGAAAGAAGAEAVAAAGAADASVVGTSDLGATGLGSGFFLRLGATSGAADAGVVAAGSAADAAAASAAAFSSSARTSAGRFASTCTDRSIGAPRAKCLAESCECRPLSPLGQYPSVASASPNCYHF